MKRAVWMELSMDEYKIPVAIADTAMELSRITGARKNNICSSACKTRSGKYKEGRFIKVMIDDDEDD